MRISPFYSGKRRRSKYDQRTIPMLECLIQTFKFPGQFGTHIDFPGHFIKGRELSEKYDVHDLIFPLCVIDVTEKVKENPVYASNVEYIKKY